MHMHMHMRMCVDCVRPSTEDLCTVGVTVRRALHLTPQGEEFESMILSVHAWAHGCVAIDT